MEFRLLTKECEQENFTRRIDEARAAHGKSFRESSELRSANRHRLAHSKLYGLFDDRNGASEQMIAGIAMHDLESFPQSCAEPDLSSLPPHDVLECSDHWSLAGGTGMLAWAGLAMPMRLLGTRAVLAYLAADSGDGDHAGFYSLMGFVNAGLPVEHPFVENSTGGRLRVQPVVLQGDALERAINGLARNCLEFSDDWRVFKLRNVVRPHVRRVPRRSVEAAPAPALSADASAAAITAPA
ncbi:MAG TPA: hypothetical protein VJN94_03960 [Candidatus Binataceae bacterium]|nr:hypothetical protein [Candidatus Binataceae bacterium]